MDSPWNDAPRCCICGDVVINTSERYPRCSKCRKEAARAAERNREKRRRDFFYPDYTLSVR